MERTVKPAATVEGAQSAPETSNIGTSATFTAAGQIPPVQSGFREAAASPSDLAFGAPVASESAAAASLKRQLQQIDPKLDGDALDYTPQKLVVLQTIKSLLRDVRDADPATAEPLLAVLDTYAKKSPEVAGWLAEAHTKRAVEEIDRTKTELADRAPKVEP